MGQRSMFHRGEFDRAAVEAAKQALTVGEPQDLHPLVPHRPFYCCAGVKVARREDGVILLVVDVQLEDGWSGYRHDLEAADGHLLLNRILDFLDGRVSDCHVVHILHDQKAVQAFVLGNPGVPLTHDTMVGVAGSPYQSLFVWLVQQRPGDVPAQACAEVLVQGKNAASLGSLRALLAVPELRAQIHFRKLLAKTLEAVAAAVCVTQVLGACSEPWDQDMKRLCGAIQEAAQCPL